MQEPLHSTHSLTVVPDHLLHLQVEEADHFGGFLMLQSMAGGTGAGFGARVAEALRDEFPCAFLMNHSIW